MQALNTATAEMLAQWENGDFGPRVLRLRDSAQRAVDEARRR